MGIRGLLLVALAGLAQPIAAGTLYRCEDASGARTYANAKVAGTRCTALGTYRSTPTRSTPAQGSAAARSSVASARSAPRAASRRPSFKNVIALGGDQIRPRPALATAPAALPDVAATASSAAKVPQAPKAQQVVFRTAEGDGKVVAAPAATGSRVTRGAVYKFVKDGITHYTNVRPPGAAAAKVLFSYIETCYACGVRAGVNFNTMKLNAQSFAAEIAATAAEFGVDEALVRAVIHAESAFNPNALSHAGAQGLMQLMPGTARRFGVTDAFAASQNIRGGVKYLAWLLDRFNGNVTLAAAAYNAGEGAVDRYGGVPPYAETQRYVERVAILAERYRGDVAAR